MNKPGRHRQIGPPGLGAFACGIVGRVDGIWIKPARSAAFLSVEEALAMAGAGLEGDAHCDPLSPRQLLLASSTVYQGLALPEHALWENLKLGVDTTDMLSGQLLKIGQDVLIELTFHCEACNRLNEILPGLARNIANRRGVLARVVRGGVIKIGDQVSCTGNSGARWSDQWQDRVAQVLAAVPQGYVIEYGQFARRAGVDSSYCRAFPNLLKRLGEGLATKAVPTKGAGKRWRGEKT